MASPRKETRHEGIQTMTLTQSEDEEEEEEKLQIQEESEEEEEEEEEEELPVKLNQGYALTPGNYYVDFKINNLLDLVNLSGFHKLYCNGLSMDSPYM